MSQLLIQITKMF